MHGRVRSATGIALVDKIPLNMEKGKLNGTVFLDLSKDFEKVH